MSAKSAPHSATPQQVDLSKIDLSTLQILPVPINVTAINVGVIQTAAYVCLGVLKPTLQPDGQMGPMSLDWNVVAAMSPIVMKDLAVRLATAVEGYEATNGTIPALKLV